MHKYTEAYIHTHGDNTYILKSYRNITYHHLNTFLKSNINLFRVRTFCGYIFNYSRQCASNHSTRAWITSELLHWGALLWRRDLQLRVHLLARLYKSDYLLVMSNTSYQCILFFIWGLQPTLHESCFDSKLQEWCLVGAALFSILKSYRCQIP